MSPSLVLPSVTVVSTLGRRCYDDHLDPAFCTLASNSPHRKKYTFPLPLSKTPHSAHIVHCKNEGPILRLPHQGISVFDYNIAIEDPPAGLVVKALDCY